MSETLHHLLTALRALLLVLLAQDLSREARRGLIAALDVAEDGLGLPRSIPRRSDRRGSSAPHARWTD